MVCLPNRMTKVELGLGVVCLVCVATTFISSIIFVNDINDADDACIDGCALTFVGCIFNLIGVILGLVFTGMCCCGGNCGPAEATNGPAKGTMEVVATVEETPDKS